MLLHNNSNLKSNYYMKFCMHKDFHHHNLFLDNSLLVLYNQKALHHLDLPRNQHTRDKFRTCLHTRIYNLYSQILFQDTCNILEGNYSQDMCLQIHIIDRNKPIVLYCKLRLLF